MDKIRIDQWLWAARFFKTRSLAQKAVEGGKVRVADATVKPAKEIKVGDRITLHIGAVQWLVDVRQLSSSRGSATIAQTLYEETAESRLRRAQQVEARRYEREPSAQLKGRPTKRQRRDLERLRSDE